MMEIPSLKTEEIDAKYDSEQQLLLVAYQGVLSPRVTTQFYEWLRTVIQDFPALLNEARGSIFDFRAVTEFQSNNMITASRQSSTVSKTPEVRDHPVALIVDTILQEQIVRTTMRLTEQVDRKRVVHSVEEAKEFIANWHEKQKA